jgi:hypothetical protein
MSIEVLALIGTLVTIFVGAAVVVSKHRNCPYCKTTLTKYIYKSTIGRPVIRVECKKCGYKTRLQ